MINEKIPLTAPGLQTLKDELALLETEKLEQVKERVKRARSFCDFHKDSEYEAALDELEKVQKRIATLTYTIQQATVLEKTDQPIVELGKTVVLKELPDGPRETYTIVSPAEADLLTGKISIQSPMAKSILHSEVNDVITVETPGGSRKIKVIHVST